MIWVTRFAVSVEKRKLGPFWFSLVGGTGEPSFIFGCRDKETDIVERSRPSQLLVVVSDEHRWVRGKPKVRK